VFVEEAKWIESTLAERRLAPGTTVLDIGSSTEDFRTEVQPHIDRHVLAPLRASGAEIVHVDAKSGEGIDVVCDITDPAVDLVEQVGARYGLVLCCNMLEHVVDRPRTVAQVTAAVAPSGALVLTVPGRYRFHEDPIDTMFRPSPQELVELVGEVAPQFRPIKAESVQIRDLQYYNLRSRYKRERVIEAGFRLIPRYRWRQSCTLFERPA
jgi:SAM-dependent methyltransferase